MAHFVLVPDPTDEPAPGRFELFADVPDVCNVAQVAESFGVSRQTVYNLVASGALSCIHIGRAVRITKQAMVDFITSQEVKA